MSEEVEPRKDDRVRNRFAALIARLPLVRSQAQVLDETSPLFKLFAGLYSTSSGVSVTSDSAVASVAVLACLIVRSESMMLVPGDVFRRDGRSRLHLEDHPVDRLISDAPNELMSAEEFWRWKQINEDLTGNAYARIEWSRGRPVALWPLLGSRPQAIVGTGSDNRARLIYRYSGDGSQGLGGESITPANDYAASEILHFKGPYLRSPFEARSLVEITAENIGLGIASERFFAKFLGNGTHFPQYLQTEQSLKKESLDALREQLEDMSGLLPAGTTRIFDRGLKVMSNDMSLKDADLTAQQRWVLEQVCRTWRTPLGMVQDLTHGTYTNSEQQDLWFAKHTVAPICRNTEGALRTKLFLPSERRDHYIKFNVNGLLRGDFKTRAEGYSLLINSRVLSPNEARGYEDWNPYDGGDEYVSNGSLQTVGSGNSNALALLFEDAASRVKTRAAQDADRGRDQEATMTFARDVFSRLAPVARELGCPIDVESVARAAVDAARLTAPPRSEA